MGDNVFCKITMHKGFMLGTAVALIVAWISDNAIPLFWAWVVLGAIGVLLGARYPSDDGWRPPRLAPGESGYDYHQIRDGLTEPVDAVDGGFTINPTPASRARFSSRSATTPRTRTLTPGMKICQLIFELTMGTPDKAYSGQFRSQRTNQADSVEAHSPRIRRMQRRPRERRVCEQDLERTVAVQRREAPGR